MSPSPVRMVLCVCVGVAAGCGSAHQDPAPGDAPDLGPSGKVDGGTDATATWDAGHDSRQEQVDVGPHTSWFGSLLAVDVADAPCVAPGGTAAIIASGLGGGPVFQRTGSAGAKRFAFGPDTLSFMTFGADGSNPSNVTTGPAALEGDGAGLMGLVPGLSSLDLQAYDADAAPLGAAVRLVDGPNGALSLGIGPTSTLAVFRSDGTIIGRIVANGAPGAAIDFGAGSGGTGPAVTRAVHNGTDYTVVWSRTLAEQRDGTSFARVTPDGAVTDAKRIIVTEEKHQLVDLVRLPSGYAVLLNEGYPTRNFAIARLNDDGLVIPPIRRFSGSGFGWDLASAGSELGVVGTLADGRAVFRPLDSSGNPLGPWVCMDDSVPGTDFFGQVGIEADGSGYAMVVKLADGSVAYRRTDHMGTGDP